MSDDANVSNSPTSTNPDIPVRLLEVTATGKKIQVVALGFVSGGVESLVDESTGMPVNIVGGSISASLASSSTATRSVVSVDSTAGGKQIWAANASRKGGIIKVDPGGSESVYIAFATSASNTDIPHAPGDVLRVADGAMKWTGAVWAFCTAGPVNVYAVEFT